MLRRLFGLLRGGDKPAPPPSAPEPPPAPSPFLHREALLDRHQQVVAYQFAVERPERAWSAASEKFFDGALISQFLDGPMETVLGKRLGFLPLGVASLDHPDLARLPKERLALVCAPPTDTPLELDVLLARLTALAEAGHILACGQDLETRGLPEALELARFILLDDTAHMAPTDLLARARHLRQRYPAAQLVARQIDSQELLQACMNLGFSLFQGDFVTRRPQQTGKTLSPYRLVVVELLNGVRRQAGFDELAGMAWYDPALAYRLLRFVNSAAFGLREKIDNVKRAMTYVGRDELYRWLTLLLFSLGQDTHPLDEALRENALVRARLAEQLAQGRMSARECDEVFVVGILSVIDALFEMPMAEALAQLTLPEAVTQALVNRSGKYAPYLQLAIACEESDQAAIATLASACEHDAIQVNQRHIEALTWALGFSEALGESGPGR